MQRNIKPQMVCPALVGPMRLACMDLGAHEGAPWWHSLTQEDGAYDYTRSAGQRCRRRALGHA